jgi:hypothetical protein
MEGVSDIQRHMGKQNIVMSSSSIYWNFWVGAMMRMRRTMIIVMAS